MMENKLVQRFINEVNEAISSEQERDALFDALKKYQASSDVSGLVGDLRQVLNEPSKLEIYEYVRPLIRPQHQQQYDKMAPAAPGQKLRVIRLRRRQNESLGFAVRGGFEHNIGVFVSHVEPGSQAEQHGLKVGDEIVRVNGFTIVEAIHEEVLNLIKGKDEIELKVTNIGMIPVKRNPNDPVTWQYVDKAGNTKQEVPVSSNQTGVPVEEVKIFINTRGAASLGCTIMSGPKTFPGVFVETVRPKGLAEAYGLGVGDQIMEVNGKSFIDIKHEEAIVELKGSKELNIVIRKGAALPLFNVQKQKSTGPGPSSQPHGSHTDRNQPGPSYRDQASEDNSWTSEILENVEAEEKRLWEEEQEKMKRQREEERVRAQFRQREIERQAELERKKKEEERRRNEEEKQRRLAEEERQLEEREKEEQRRREELERKREEDLERRMEKERQKRHEEEEKKRKLELKQQKQEASTSKGWKRKQKEKDFYRRVKLNQKEAERAKQLYFYDRKLELDALKFSRSAVLAGRAGPVSPMKPALLGAVEKTPKLTYSALQGHPQSLHQGLPRESLEQIVQDRAKWRGLIRKGASECGPKRISEAEQKRAQRNARAEVSSGSSDGRNVKEIVIRKEKDVPLDLEIEGGTDSPLGGKIMVAQVYRDGLADRNGEIRQGDQILKVNGKSLENVTLSEAQEILWNAEQTAQDTMKLVVVESDFRDDEVTYF